MDRNARIQRYGAVGLAVIGCAILAKPPWAWLPSAFAVPVAAVLIIAASVLADQHPRAALWTGIGVAGLALGLSVAWYTVGSSLWLPGLLAQTLTIKDVFSLSRGGLLLAGLRNGGVAALWAAAFYAVGVGIRRMRKTSASAL